MLRAIARGSTLRGCRAHECSALTLPRRSILGVSQSRTAVQARTQPLVAATRPAFYRNVRGSNPDHRQVCTAAAAGEVVQKRKEADEAAKDGRVPVTIITGFLGAGKTTLLNHILTGDHGRRIAVIENEFGEIDIDSELVVKREVLEGSRDSVVQLSNGCLCCTVRDDLIQALDRLYDRREEFDHVVIETTGLANPAPIISSFYMDKSLPDKCRLDGVVTVVDALNVTRHLDAEKKEDVVNEAVEQIAYADRILLNKTDLVTPAALTAVETRVRAINKLAEIKHTQKAQVDMGYVLGVGGFDLLNVEKELDVSLKRDGLHTHSHSHDHDHDHDHTGPDCTHESHKHEHDHDHTGPDCTHESHKHDHDHAEASHSHDHDHAHAHTHEGDCKDPDCTHESHQHDHAPAFKHDDKVSSVSMVLDGDMDLDKINYSLGLLLETRSEDIYRMKGLLSIHGSQYRYVYQGVHSIFEGVPDREWREGEKRVCKMVFIGRELDGPAFREAFEYCLVKEGAKEPAAV